MPLNALRNFFRLEAAGGILLVLAATVAVLVDNSPLAPWYDALLRLPVGVRIGELGLTKPLLLWVNDGLMAIFFLLVGLEVKREILEGELVGFTRLLLPTVAAIGGMVVPALIYVAMNWTDPTALAGWAVPTATDIAFALGVMSLLGSRVPLALKVLLTAIAIIDDLGAIIVIAVFYTADLSPISLLLASCALAGLAVLNRFGVCRLAPYLLLGVLLWVFVLKSGVHATLAGVAVGLAIPLGQRKDDSPLRRLEHMLHPWVAYAILPFFAFANAGISFADMAWDSLQDPLTMGIAVALFFGKQVGVFGAIALIMKSGLGEHPKDVGWGGLYGMALLTGIGFTMSLFIASLAFLDPVQINAARLGIIVGSLASGVAGYFVLARAYPPAGRTR